VEAARADDDGGEGGGEGGGDDGGDGGGEGGGDGGAAIKPLTSRSPRICMVSGAGLTCAREASTSPSAAAAG